MSTNIDEKAQEIKEVHDSLLSRINQLCKEAEEELNEMQRGKGRA